MRIRCWLVALLLVSAPTLAGPTQGTAEWVTQAVLQIPDSLRLRILATLARGDLSDAIALWELETGHEAPQWLQAFQSAFSVANQRAGPCIQVARSVFEGFKQLGANPAYLRFTAKGTQWGDEFIAFERRADDPLSTIRISDNAIHYAVQVEDRIYDAMTGPTGLTVAEYMKRILSPGGLSTQPLSQLP